MHRGYTKRWRKKWDSDLARHPLANHLFDYLIDHAAWQETETSHRYKFTVLQRGDVLIGTEQMAANTGLSRQTVRTALTYLKSTSRITIKSTNRFSIISIINYDTYQGEDKDANQQNNQQINQQPTSSQPAANHIEELKALKELNPSSSTDDGRRSRKRPRKQITYTPEFTEFWNIYPRSIGKGEAFIEWQKVITDGYPAEKIIRATKEFTDAMNKEGREESKIRYPCRFLKKDFWKDFCFKEVEI